jgi:hypothetical protein
MYKGILAALVILADSRFEIARNIARIRAVAGAGIAYVDRPIGRAAADIICAP